MTIKLGGIKSGFEVWQEDNSCYYLNGEGIGRFGPLSRDDMIDIAYLLDEVLNVIDPPAHL